GSEATHGIVPAAMSVAELPSNPKSTLVPLTRNQIRGFWASWGGWALDGMDSFIYALVLLPSLRELLPRSGIAPTKGNVGFYGGLLFALFLFGWGMAFLWGPIAGLGAAWRDGAGEVETKGRRGSLRENLEAIFRPFLEHAAPPNGSEFLVYARIDLRFVGGNGLCARRGDDAGGSGRENRTTGSAAGFARGDAGFLRDDSWLPGDAVARGKSRAPRRAGGLFRADACVHCADVRKGFLSRSSRASVV